MTFKPFVRLAPAKINRYLHILGKRPDGYHTIDSTMQFLNLWDILYFSPLGSSSTDCILEAPLQCGPTRDNLVWKAAMLLKPSAKSYVPVHIRLKKHIPSGAGLGGGSSNAASTLLALNHLWNCGHSGAELQTMALTLGADIPFFLFGRAAIAKGLGEKLIALSELPTTDLLLILPDCHVSTASMYQNPELQRHPPDDAIKAGIYSTFNAFEAVAIKTYPLIKDIFSQCLPYGIPQLNGSGSSLFLKCSSKKEALLLNKEIKQSLPSSSCHVLKSLEHSPYYWGVAKW
jgi:4-diphosphocytidyl-2-C-methyl-D-erythritol kinase